MPSHKIKCNILFQSLFLGLLLSTTAQINWLKWKIQIWFGFTFLMDKSIYVCLWLTVKKIVTKNIRNRWCRWTDINNQLNPISSYGQKNICHHLLFLFHSDCQCISKVSECVCVCAFYLFIVFLKLFNPNRILCGMLSTTNKKPNCWHFSIVASAFLSLQIMVKHRQVATNYKKKKK